MNMEEAGYITNLTSWRSRRFKFTLGEQLCRPSLYTVWSQIIHSLLTAGWVGAVPVLSREGLSLWVDAAVHHSDQVMLTQSPLCQCYGPQTRRLNTHKETTVNQILVNHVSFCTMTVQLQRGWRDGWCALQIVKWKTGTFVVLRWETAVISVHVLSQLN